MSKFNPEQLEAAQSEADKFRNKFIEENKDNFPAYVEAVKKLNELNEFCSKNGVIFFASLPFEEKNPGFMFYNSLKKPIDLYDDAYHDDMFRGCYINGQYHMHNFVRAFNMFGVKMYDKAFSKTMLYNLEEKE